MNPIAFKKLLRMLQVTDDTVINLSKLNIDDLQANELFAVLNILPNIKEIDLSNNNISSIGVSALANNKTLESIDLSWNKIDDTGAVALASNKTLKSIKLDVTQITDVGAHALAENTTLETIYVIDSDREHKYIIENIIKKW